MGHFFDCTVCLSKNAVIIKADYAVEADNGSCPVLTHHLHNKPDDLTYSPDAK